MDFITVHTALNPAEADLIHSRLDAAGFHPVIRGLAALSMDGYSLATGGVDVQVPAGEAEDALELLKSNQTQ